MPTLRAQNILMLGVQVLCHFGNRLTAAQQLLACQALSGIVETEHYITFPDKETMQRIVDVHYPGLRGELVTEALEIFFDVRKVPGLKKRPSTSELIDWIKLLLADDIPEDILRNRDTRKAIPPLHGALLKNEQDVHLLERLAFMTRREG